MCHTVPFDIFLWEIPGAFPEESQLQQSHATQPSGGGSPSMVEDDSNVVVSSLDCEGGLQSQSERTVSSTVGTVELRCRCYDRCCASAVRGQR